MKKNQAKKTEINSVKNSELETVSDTNEINLSIDGANDFVLLTLDVKETNTNTQNTTTSQEVDFILFPLDLKKKLM